MGEMKRQTYSRESMRDFVAPLSVRLGAVFFDYIMILFPPVIALAIGRLFGLDGTRLLNSEIVSVGWFLAIFTFFANHVLFPVLTGQTFGKRLLGLRIVDLEGRLPMLRAVLKRNLLGYLINVITFGITFLPALGGVGRGLHDRISGTVVIRARA